MIRLYLSFGNVNVCVLTACVASMLTISCHEYVDERKEELCGNAKHLDRVAIAPAFSAATPDGSSQTPLIPNAASPQSSAPDHNTSLDLRSRVFSA